MASIFTASLLNTARTLVRFVDVNLGRLPGLSNFHSLRTRCSAFCICTGPLSIHVSPNTAASSQIEAPKVFHGIFIPFLPLIASYFGKLDALERMVPTAPMSRVHKYLNSRGEEKNLSMYISYIIYVLRNSPLEAGSSSEYFCTVIGRKMQLPFYVYRLYWIHYSPEANGEKEGVVVGKIILSSV